MKRVFLIVSLVIALTLGGVSVATSATHTHETIIARVFITDVDCPCEECGEKAIDCVCRFAVKALEDAGFSAEDIEKYLNENQSVDL